MKNTFKSNYRFAVLAEETNNNNPFNKKDKNKQHDNQIKKEGNCFTSNSNNSFNNYDRRPINRDFESTKGKELREKQEREKEERRKKILQEEKEKSLAVENFPDLLGNINNTDLILPKITQEAFVDKVKFIKPVIESKKPENIIRQGWIEIKQEPNTKKVITTSNLPFRCIDNNDNNNVHVLCSLADLHERRTKEYIDMWGYDTWEKMFTSPNYDYDYFNKLDEQYEEEMENENEIDNESYYSN